MSSFLPRRWALMRFTAAWLALWVPLEYVAIVGLTIGGFIAGNDIKYIKKTVGALPSIFKGSKFSKALYVDLLAMLYEILAKVRKEGLMSIEADVENPQPARFSASTLSLRMITMSWNSSPTICA